LSDTKTRIEYLAADEEVNLDDIEAQNKHLNLMTKMLFRKKRSLISLAVSECTKRLKKFRKQLGSFENQGKERLVEFREVLAKVIGQNQTSEDPDLKEKYQLDKFFKLATKVDQKAKTVLEGN